MSDSLYEKISVRRKELQEKGLLPLWYSSAGLQLFEERYEYDTTESVRGQFKRIARTAAGYLKGISLETEAEERFFDMLWKGWLSPSTPVLANMGTNRGLSVSCSGAYIQDSIDSFYSVRHETALLTKHGFGTSAYLGDIRPRGTPISVGGKASGVVPLFKGFVQDMRDVAQGTARRGAWAGYLPIDHGDFDELIDFIHSESDDANVGWIVTDAFIEKLNKGDTDSIRRYQKAMKIKMVTGKGYFLFIDKANRHRPECYKKHDLTIKNSNLCSEIMLANDADHTYTCVLSSMNLAKYDEWVDTDAVYWATIFLDCVAEDFITKAKNISGLENAVRFTEKGRALGLGACGLHTYFQDHMIPFEGFDAHLVNHEMFSFMNDESLRASKFLAEKLGEPEWCEGFGIRNTHRIAVAPTKSTALLMGGVSEGINPDPAMSYTQLTAGGEMERINPPLLTLMKKKGVYTKAHIKEVKESLGSVQKVDWLSDDEKRVFRTAFEINQESILRLAGTRGKYIDQWQSLNLFFSADEDEAWISHIHKLAFEDEKILALYYIYSQAGVQAAKTECLACS